MSFIEQHHKLAYSQGVTMVAQQTRNPLLGAVTIITAEGEAKSVTDLLASVEADDGEDYNRRNVESPATGSRRWAVRPKPIRSGQYIEEEDKLDTMMDPTSNIVRVHTMAVNRTYADRLLGIRRISKGVYTISEGGILGQAREGKVPGVGTPLPAAQYVAAGGTGMTLTKLRTAILKLNLAEFGMEEQDELYCAITAFQKDDLIGIAAASGTALNAFELKQIQDGKPTTLMGVTWIFTNRLPKNTAGARLCPIWSKANIIGAEWEAINGDGWNDTHADNKPYVRVRARIDAVRAQDEGVIVIECVEPAL